METERISIVTFRHQNQAVQIDIEDKAITYRSNDSDQFHQSIEVELLATNTIGVAQECIEWLQIPIPGRKELMEIDAVIRKIEKAIKAKTMRKQKCQHAT